MAEFVKASSCLLNLVMLRARVQHRSARHYLALSIFSALLFANPVWCLAAAKYWDTNGPTVGASGAPSGIWDVLGTTNNWNASDDGTGPAVAWTAGSDAIFAAGGDATGAYNITLSGNPSLAAVLVEEGAVSISGAGAGSDTLDFGPSPEAMIDIAGGSSFTQNGSVVFTGTGGLTKTGAGTLVLRGTNTIAVSGTGNHPFLTVGGGVVDFTTDLNLGAVPIVTDNGAALTVDGGTLKYAGSTDLTLAVKRGVRIGPSGGTIDVPNAVDFALPASTPAAAALTGNGTITKTGLGRFSLNTSQTTFTGKYVVTGGSLSFAIDGNLGAVPADTQPDYFTLDGGALRVSGSTNAFQLNAKRGITLGPNGGVLVAPMEGVIFYGVVAGSPGAALTVSIHDGVPDSDTIGNVYLGGANTYDGPTIIENRATLHVFKLANGGIDSGLGRSSSAASNLVLNGGIFAYEGTTAASTDRNFTMTPLGGRIHASGFNDNPVAFTSTEPITLTGIGPRTFGLGGTSEGNSAGDNIFAPAITDQGANPTTLAKSSLSTWLLTNTNNSYSGNTSITAGRLKLGASGVIPDASLVTLVNSSMFSVFDLNGFDETVRSISGANGSGSIVLGAQTLTLGAPNNETFSGVISGSGGRVFKAGSGTLTLGAVNTYTGDTVIQAGTLQINKAYLANGADVRMANGTVFNLNFSGTDIIDSLYINGLSQAIGTWGAIGSGAAHQSAIFSGSGLLQVTNFYAPNSGDFNSDGRVDAADYVVWRKNLGSNDPLPNSNGLTTPIGQAHYVLWRATFGDVVSGAGFGAEAGVPEASSVVLGLIGLCAFSVRRAARTMR
jgi:fibronectin-binding autotransporter adhesin